MTVNYCSFHYEDAETVVQDSYLSTAEEAFDEVQTMCKSGKYWLTMGILAVLTSIAAFTINIWLSGNWLLWAYLEGLLCFITFCFALSGCRNWVQKGEASLDLYMIEGTRRPGSSV